jgi:hypothetical protein
MRREAKIEIAKYRLSWPKKNLFNEIVELKFVQYERKIYFLRPRFYGF